MTKNSKNKSVKNSKASPKSKLQSNSKAKAPKDSKTKPSKGKGERVTIRGLFREMSTRKAGVTIGELRKEAARKGLNLEGTTVGSNDAKLRTHVVWYAVNNLDWEITVEETEGQEPRYYGKPPKAEAA